MRFGRREGISKESRRTNRAEDRLHISGAQRGKQARGSSNQGSAYLLPRRDQGGKRKGRGEGAAGEGEKHRNKILSPALARCGKHCATGCRSSGSVPTAGSRSVDASRDKGVVRKTDARSEGMKKGCEEQGEGPGRRKATEKTCADRKEKRKLGRKTKR